MNLFQPFLHFFVKDARCHVDAFFRCPVIFFFIIIKSQPVVRHIVPGFQLFQFPAAVPGFFLPVFFPIIIGYMKQNGLISRISLQQPQQQLPGLLFTSAPFINQGAQYLHVRVEYTGSFRFFQSLFRFSVFLPVQCPGPLPVTVQEQIIISVIRTLKKRIIHRFLFFAPLDYKLYKIFRKYFL